MWIRCRRRDADQGLDLGFLLGFVILTVSASVVLGWSLANFLVMNSAIELHPTSATFWCLRGDLHHLQFHNGGQEIDPYFAMRCYQRALELDNSIADAYNEKGHLWDVYFDEFGKAEQAFWRAIELGIGTMGYYASAKVLAQMGWSNDALEVLAAGRCPYADDDDSCYSWLKSIC
jgi:hypothetical protein